MFTERLVSAGEVGELFGGARGEELLCDRLHQLQCRGEGIE